MIALTEADLRIQECIEAKRSFVLDAGAGSGKTSSLVEALRYLVSGAHGKKLARQSQRIACITFTNVAKDEIVERTGNNPLITVSTIHEFLWAIIKPYQKALRVALIEHNAGLTADSARRRDEAELAQALQSASVSYSDRGAEFLEGRLFHDDLLSVASNLFGKNPLVAKIAAARHPFIFVDEYQDTSPLVVDILIDRVLAGSPGVVVLGFFGDKFQSIYEGTVGEIPEGQRGKLECIAKGENYRCSDAVIRLLNKVRIDIQQHAAGKNEPGSAVYLHVAPSANTDDPIEKARAYLREKLGWQFDDHTSRELYLTHKLIAKKAGYEQLLDTYQKRGQYYRDRLLDGEDPFLTFARAVVEEGTRAWESGRTGRVLAILRAHGLALDDKVGKNEVKQAIEAIVGLRSTGTVGDVLRKLRDTRLVALPDELRDQLILVDKGGLAEDAPEDQQRTTSFFAALLALPYTQISAYARFFEEHTAFSTKHGVKGAEFNTVLVVLDDKGARWNNYAFDKYLSGEDAAAGKEERLRRTRNLFYVCCSRARKNLAVIDLGGSSQAKTARITELFGDANVYSV